MEPLFIDRLRQVVCDHGDRPALMVDGAVTHSYQQLWEASEKVAAGLQSLGVAKESLVGIQLARSAEFIITLIGTWRAGAAYLPLDPALPRSRLNYLVDDSSARVVITDIRDLLNHNKPFEPRALSESDLAYVIYTSGSTGRPKGVAIEQRGLVGLLDAQIKAFQLQPNSRVFFLLSTSFDASLSDIGTTLLSGAALCLESNHRAQGIAPAVLLELLQQRQITHIDIPPALLALLDERPLPTLQTIVIGGEPCQIEVVRRWARRCRVVNVYGPTEATICTSLGLCDPDAWNRPLIGQPVDGIDYRIDLRGDGPEGELLIGGRGLARGYINDDQLTNARFVVMDGRRWYRTGDLVRRDPDGEYVFLGRIDRQLKLRGNRIEPEEIEAVLSSVPQVIRCAVLVRPVSAASSRKILVAFVVVDEGEIDPALLRNHLKQSLPAWMIPHRIEFAETLPETSTGKVDLEQLKSVPLTTLTTPETESRLQHLLAEIWQSVLGVSCNIRDDFFELGGDSLAMLEVIALAKTRGIVLAPTLIATERTIRDICANLSGGGGQTRNAMSAEALREDIQNEVAALRKLAARQTINITLDASQHRILLTGATGFLGCRVLEQILRRTDRRVVCVLRGRDQRDAWNRLEKTTLEQQLNITESDLARVEVILGDITLRSCGLSLVDWSRLAETTDIIFHCAARVQLLEDYGQLRSANVTGCCEMLRFGLSGIPKQIHHASTLSVFVGTDLNRGRLCESDDLSATQKVYGGYAQSKWAAEVLLREIGLPADRSTVFRFGLLCFDSQSGAIPQHDLLTLAIRGLVNLGCVPSHIPDVRFDLTPVDFAAEAMVHLGMMHPSNRQSSTYHVANATTVSFARLLQCLKRVRPDLKEVELDDFLQQAENSNDPLQATACLALCDRLVSKSSSSQLRQLDLFQSTGVSFDTTFASQDLEGSGIMCPPADDRLITNLLQRILA